MDFDGLIVFIRLENKVFTMILLEQEEGKKTHKKTKQKKNDKVYFCVLSLNHFNTELKSCK